MSQLQAEMIKLIVLGALDGLGLANGDTERILENSHRIGPMVKRLFLELAAPIDESISQLAARKIMGKNFFGIPEIERLVGAISDEQKFEFSEIPFSKEKLASCAKTHILFFDGGNSFEELFPLVGELLDNGRQLVMNTRDGKLAECVNKKGEMGWKLVPLVATAEACNKTWSEQQDMSEGREILSVRQIMYMAYLRHMFNGESIESCHVRTGDRDLHGNPLKVSFYSDIHIGCKMKDNERDGYTSVFFAEKS